MPREKPYFREVVEDLREQIGKTMLTATDVKKYLHIRHDRAAIEYLEGQKEISIYKLASKLL